MIKHLFQTFLIFFAFTAVLSGGVVGKISGTITDAETGESLIGVNVMVEGTYIGAASDMSGYFVMLNIPPGYYSVRVSMLGYADLVVNDLQVVIDQTTQLDLTMSPETLELSEVVVTARRPLVVPDVSASQLNIESEMIENLPVQNVNDVLTLQAGIETGLQGIIIRGGGANQTVFMVDGLSQNDERSNYPYSAVSLSALEEIQIQTGGFAAEYGQARSGIVNVTTKEGSSHKYSGSIAFQYSPPAEKHFGLSVYDRYSYFNRPYYDPDVMWTGTKNGAWDTHTQQQYPNFDGWNAVSQQTISQDEDPSNDLTPEEVKRLFEWYRRRQGDIKKPDYVIDVGFGGPVPYISENLGNLRFYLSHFNEQEMFVFPLARDSYSDNHTQLKLTADVNPSMKVVFSALYGEEHSVSPYSWTTTPTGYILRSQDAVADLTSSSPEGLMVPYMPGSYSPSSIYRQIYGFRFINSLSSRTFYEIKLQYKKSFHNTYQTTDRDFEDIGSDGIPSSQEYGYHAVLNPDPEGDDYHKNNNPTGTEGNGIPDVGEYTKSNEIFPDYFVDEAPYGYSGSGYGSTGPGGIHLGGWMNLGRDSTVNSTTTFRFDFTSQINDRNQIKTGIELIYNDYNVKSSTVNPSNNFWNRSLVYRIFPYRIGTYIQDKLEFKGIIANLGLRLDYSDANTEKYDLVPYDPFFSQDLGESIEEDAPSEDSKPDLMLSPRVGISHPITVNSKLYFNYGHFGAEPFSTYRFRIQRESAGNVKYIGDPNLEMEKTVAYELGYEHNLFNLLLFRIAGYYKDVTQQPGWVLYRGDVTYREAANNNYEDIRGVEITLSKQYGDWISGFINYTYDVRTSGYFGLREYNDDIMAQREYESKKPEQTRRHPRPYARMNLNIHAPRQFGPQLMGFYPLANFNVNILADWRTGRFETYNPKKIPGIVDDVQWADWYNVDLRFSKTITVNNTALQLYLDISNLFDFKYLSESGFADNIDRENYLASLRFSWEDGIDKGNDRFGDYRSEDITYDPLEPNPENDSEIAARNDKRIEDKTYIDMPNITSLTFLNPQAIRFGIRIDF